MSRKAILIPLAALGAFAAISVSAQSSAQLSAPKPSVKSKTALKSDANPKKPYSKEPDGTGGDPKGPDGNPKGPDGNPPPKGPDGKRLGLNKAKVENTKTAAPQQSMNAKTK